MITPIYEEAEPGVYYDSSPMIAPDGKIIGVYRKTTTGIVYWPEGGDVSYEDYYFKTGNEFPLFRISNIGCMHE